MRLNNMKIGESVVAYTDAAGNRYRDTKGKMAGDKDYQRMTDMERKAGGDVFKLISLANQMAAVIKDKEKALRRAEAADNTFDEKVAKKIGDIFRKRAKEL